MENKDNLELFNLYLEDRLSENDKKAFEDRLAADKDFRTDFRVFLLTVDGIIKESRQDNIEFGTALGDIDESALLSIIGREENIGKEENKSSEKKPVVASLYRNLAWISSIAAIIVIGIFSVIGVMQSGNDKVDNILAYYNDFAAVGRGGAESVSLSSLSEKEIANIIPSLEKEYYASGSQDEQQQKIAGLTLAMAYLRTHQRAKAKNILNELEHRYADDEIFSEKCREILDFLR
ncbi:MAG: hypothetical protein K2G90_07155 [Muribaculaceae bacterium]|nr:hypothetical protein [Muribaculaceae bacterium]